MQQNDIEMLWAEIMPLPLPLPLPLPFKVSIADSMQYAPPMEF